MTPISLTIVLKAEKRNSVKKLTPIYIRLIRSGSKSEARLDRQYDLSDEQVLKWSQIYSRLPGKSNLVNDHLDELNARFNKYKRDKEFSDCEDPLNDIITKILNKKPAAKNSAGIGAANVVTVLQYVNKYYAEEIEHSNSKDDGTKRNYMKAINHLKSFLNHKSLLLIGISTVDYSLAQEFKNYLETAYTYLKKKASQPVSSSSNIMRLKPIFRKAKKEKLIDENPFDDIKLSFDSPLAKMLSIEQIKAINSIDLSNNPSLQFAKDFFLLCCFSGLSYTDAISLSNDELVYMNDGRIKIHSLRDKSGVQIKQIMLKRAVDILHKYKELPGGPMAKYLLPHQTGENPS